MIFLKQLISYLFMPLSLLWLSLVLLLFLRKRRKKIYRYGIVILGISSYLLSILPVKWLLFYPLEAKSYQMYHDSRSRYPQAQAIVVLGGGIALQGSWGPPRLGEDPLSRLSHAVKVFRSLHGKVPIIFSSGSTVSAKLPSEAEVAETYLKLWSISNYYLEDESLNTYENAMKTKELILRLNNSLERPVILVTSALHIPRATAAFQAQGFTVLPCPSHYQISPSCKIDLFGFLPNIRNIDSITFAWHEYFGLLSYKLMGRI